MLRPTSHLAPSRPLARARAHARAQLELEPNVVYILRRVQEMMNVQIHPQAIAHFMDAPTRFKFTTQDLEPAARVKHNMPMLDFSEATTLGVQANATRAKRGRARSWPAPRASIVAERLWGGAAASSQDVLERVGCAYWET